MADSFFLWRSEVRRSADGTTAGLPGSIADLAAAADPHIPIQLTPSIILRSWSCALCRLRRYRSRPFRLRPSPPPTRSKDGSFSVAPTSALPAGRSMRMFSVRPRRSFNLPAFSIPTRRPAPFASGFRSIFPRRDCASSTRTPPSSQSDMLCGQRSVQRRHPRKSRALRPRFRCKDISVGGRSLQDGLPHRPSAPLDPVITLPRFPHQSDCSTGSFAGCRLIRVITNTGRRERVMNNTSGAVSDARHFPPRSDPMGAWPVRGKKKISRVERTDLAGRIHDGCGCGFPAAASDLSRRTTRPRHLSKSSRAPSSWSREFS